MRPGEDLLWRRRAQRAASSTDPARWEVERRVRMLQARYAGILVMGVAAGLIFSWRMGVVLTIGVGAYNGLHHLLVLRRGRPASWLPVSDVLVGVSVAAIEPEAVLPATLVMITAVAFATSVGSRLPPAVATLVGTAGLLAISAVEDDPTIRITALGFGLAGALVLLGIGSTVDSEDRLHTRLTGLIHNVDLGLVVVSVRHPSAATPEVRIVIANPAADAFLDRPISEAEGDLVTEVLPGLAETEVLSEIGRVAATGSPLHVEDLAIRVQGATRTATVEAFRLPDGLVAVSIRDTTSVTRAARALRRQALSDGLTGLPNRSHLEQHLRTSIEDLADDERLALLIMDLDQFKEVNDALGHAVGDRLLVAVADRLRTMLHGVFVARLGGDEFAIVLRGAHVDEVAATATAEEVTAFLSAAFSIDDLRLQTNVSIGIALVPDHATDVDEVLRRADVAMYVSKRGGHGHAVYRPDEDRSSVARLTLIGDLRDAVPRGQLVLHYQPVLDLNRGVVTRTEALVRWQHPEHGLLMPDAFIGLAALSGATRPIASWVLGEATHDAAAWRAAGHDLGVAVNLSVRNLFDRDLLGVVERALERSGLPPGELIVELTESELMDDPSVALAQFHAFQSMGVGTSVDDFGTGYSSLTYLRDLPLTEIKIDRSFVSDMHRRGGAYTIVRSMIDLGHNLGLEVVAEGAEHPDDLPTLARLGCDRAQGFHIARPMPLDDLLRWLEEAAPQGIAAQPPRSA